ncbi:MAG: hypothetical protein J6T57_00790 [Alphaproteobacteria bacterium]|nr:hypothetical protein [Alphaproteobacteria bacterium]
MRFIFIGLLLGACATTWNPAPGFKYVPISAGEYEIATYQKITNKTDTIHIYIEGDGHAFDAHGAPTADPTPHGTMVRDLAMRDGATNVAYVARPCQFIMSPKCSESDWTDGRFSKKIINTMSKAIKKVAGNRPIILIGYSGGAMISGLVIEQNPAMPVKEWITIAGVLNHHEWTRHFGDAPLTKSQDLQQMPNVPARHFIGMRDRIVPPELTRATIGDTGQIIEIPDTGHSDFTNMDLF